MPLSNHERVGKGFAHLTKGLSPFVERELKAAYGDEWRHKTRNPVRDDKAKRRTIDPHSEWEAQSLLLAMSNTWSDVFQRVLGRAERSLISGACASTLEAWADQKPFTTDDAYRALDSMSRLLAAVSALRPPMSNRKSRSSCASDSRNTHGRTAERWPTCPSRGSHPLDSSRGAKLLRLIPT